jgi:DNA-binding protein HU-beta
MIGKQIFISKISKELKQNRQEVKVETVVDSFLETLENCLINNEKITFQGLFSLDIVNRSARKGKNPRSGEEIIIPERKTVSFKLSPHLKLKLNK